jgi:hypothetical protein
VPILDSCTAAKEMRCAIASTAGISAPQPLRGLKAGHLARVKTKLGTHLQHGRVFDQHIDITRRRPLYKFDRATTPSPGSAIAGTVLR